VPLNKNMKKEERIKKTRQKRRVVRIRKKILAEKRAPRFSVFRSNKYIYVQVFDDLKGTTLASASEKEVEDSKLSRLQKAEEVGRTIAKKVLSKKIKNVVFDKGSYKYHGRIKALADAARKEGLVF